MRNTKSFSVSVRVALGFSLLGVGCALPTGATDDVSEDRIEGAPKPLVVTETVNRKVIELVAGRKLTVSLENELGRSWRVQESGKLGAASAVGDQDWDAPSRATFTWDTKGKTGSTKVTLIQVVPNVADHIGPSAEISFTVSVVPARKR
jgi:hypothetical protein